MRLLIVTSVEAEAAAIGAPAGTEVVVGGIGRVNAAAATTEALLRARNAGRPFDAVLCAGVAGALPGSGLAIGAVVAASLCIYVEEGLLGPHGFVNMTGMGLSLGDFEGNAVPVDGAMLEVLAELYPMGPIATVATCSGTDAGAAEVARRTGALAEAMEGAAVVHAARRLGVRAIELRVISNTTGDRVRQRWDLSVALRSLGPATAHAVAALNQRR